ncbi:MAG: hypothetical protein HY897_01005 [Deltaproteobacteria bacterium]|nr:hypothetical protein [Deltaproteobacteria bacterium]
MRALIYAPIVHSEVDMGSMAGEVRRQFQEVFGPEEWKRRFASVEAMWEGLRAKLLALPILWQRVRLYQDGLPICGREREIVVELAAKGSRNHLLLGELMESGAALMGTEDPQLMLVEYRRIQKLVQAAHDRAPDSVVAELKREGESLLERRDAFIARRIDGTLSDGETGILFLGLLHRVDELLEDKFEVRHMIHNLPFGTDPWRKLKGVRS